MQAQAVGDLYGLRLKKIGRSTNAERVSKKSETRTVMAAATTLSKVQRRMTTPARKRLTWVTPHRHYQFCRQARIRVPIAPHSQVESMFQYLQRSRTALRPLRPYNVGSAWAMDTITSHAPTGSVQVVVSTPPVTLLIRARTLDVHAPGTLGPLFTSTTTWDQPLPRLATPLVSFSGPTARRHDTRRARRTSTSRVD